MTPSSPASPGRNPDAKRGSLVWRAVHVVMKHGPMMSGAAAVLMAMFSAMVAMVYGFAWDSSHAAYSHRLCVVCVGFFLDIGFTLTAVIAVFASGPFWAPWIANRWHAAVSYAARRARGE